MTTSRFGGRRAVGRNYRTMQNPWASMPRATLNLLRKMDGLKNAAILGRSTLQIVAERGTRRNPGATRPRPPVGVALQRGVDPGTESRRWSRQAVCSIMGCSGTNHLPRRSRVLDPAVAAGAGGSGHRPPPLPADLAGRSPHRTARRQGAAAGSGRPDRGHLHRHVGRFARRIPPAAARARLCRRPEHRHRGPLSCP